MNVVFLQTSGQNTPFDTKKISQDSLNFPDLFCVLQCCFYSSKIRYMLYFNARGGGGGGVNLALSVFFIFGFQNQIEIIKCVCQITLPNVFLMTFLICIARC